MTVSEWWQQVYPYAVELEKNITRSPDELSLQEAMTTLENLPDTLQKIEIVPYADDAEQMRQYLMRSVTYLIHAYEELKQDNMTEVDFYYSSSLTQIAHLHYCLVQHGFTK